MRYRLKDIFDLQMGKTPARQNMKYWDKSDCKWISIADLSRSEKYILNTKEKISDIAVKETRIRVIPANTVVMSFKLSIGKVAITADNMYSNEAIMAFNDKHVVEMLPEYIFYMFKYMRWESGSNNAVMGKTLNKATISDIEVDICTIKKQQEIIAILDKMDNILSNKYREIYLLDELVKARFVEMFGDLRDNGKGWEIKTLDELSYLITDGEHITPRRTTDGIYLLSARNILNHSLRLDDVDYIDQEEYARIAKRVVPKKGDVLISCSGTVGRCCSVPAGIKFQMVRSVALIRFKEEINPVFAEYMITSDYLQAQINGSKTASSQSNLFQGKIRALKGFAPPIELQIQFLQFVQQIAKSKAVIEKSLKELETLQASLMQKYFS